MGRKKILYVDKYPHKEERERMLAAIREIKEALEDNFDVCQIFNLNNNILSLIEFENKRWKIDALVTHTPYDPDAWGMDFSKVKPEDVFSKRYTQSLEIIRKLREKYPSMPIIAYTGAYTPMEEQKQDPRAMGARKTLISAGANEVLFKSVNGNHLEDAARIKKSLDLLLS